MERITIKGLDGLLNMIKASADRKGLKTYGGRYPIASMKLERVPGGVRLIAVNHNPDAYWKRYEMTETLKYREMRSYLCGMWNGMEIV